jgi:hypothetical protein
MKAETILSAAKNSAKTQSTRDQLECITWAPKYVEPGYTCGEAGIFFGNWNEVDRYDSALKKRVPEVDGSILPRLMKCLEKCGAEIEWSDEWTTCGECGGAVRTEPDSHWWKPSYRIMDGEIICNTCAEEDEEEDEEEEDEPQCEIDRPGGVTTN